MKALGANPVPMALSEVHAALADGVVGGSENLLTDFYARKLHDVQQHLTLSDHGYIGYAVIVNKRFWQGLPAELRNLLEQALRETTEFERAIAQSQHDQALEKLRAAGTTQIHTLTAQERAAWRKPLTALHKDYRELAGKDTIARIHKIAAEVEKETKTKKP
jgi:C4-dicarboxylate-binding protein DctP